ncbi:Pesticin receptor (IRPC) [Durusdinium trenchii]|uniref:Pesticin receptor (IRPC) n=1 Tax=Durusdinium trenchii TaxID=1381693 RepID=A0ABP0LJZ8_9DINO
MASAAITALSAGAASAQSDQIIVTATKRPQTLQEVPVAVSVVDAQVIEDSQIVDLFDIQTVVPSLRVSQLQNSSQTTFVIRGFGNGANNPGIESSVGVFIDGVFRSRSASAILDLPTLERVEVLRGPQSTLFGKNVSAGAISITTKGPEYEWGGSVEATYGTFGQTIFRGSLTGPISDTVAFRISGNINNRDGTATNIVTDTDINDRDRFAVRGQLLWEPADTVSFRLIGDYNKIDENCCAAVQIQNGPATAIAIGAPPPFGLGEIIGDDSDPFARNATIDTDTFNRLEGYGGSLQGDWDLGFAQVTSITSYREQTDDTNTDVDFSAADLAENPQNRTFETFTQEIRIASSGDNRFDWLVGGFYFDETVELERDVTFGSQIRPFADNLLTLLGEPGALSTLEGALMLPGGTFFGPGQGVIGDYVMDNRSFSIFGQADFEITDRLTFTGGVQFFDPQVSFPDPTNPLDDGQLDGDQVTYSLQLAYDVTDSINTYFTYATGWKAGAFNLSSDSRPPDPVTGVGRTAGPEDPLTFTFGATYLDAEYDSFLLAPCTPFDPVNCGNGEGSRDLSGTTPAGIHPLSVSTSMTYRHDFTDSLSGFGRLEYLHETATPLIETIPQNITRDVKVVNASIGFQTEGGFDVLFWGRNLTNNNFFLQGFPTVVQAGSVSGYPNQPRTYGVTLRKSF